MSVNHAETISVSLKMEKMGIVVGFRSQFSLWEKRDIRSERSVGCFPGLNEVT